MSPHDLIHYYHQLGMPVKEISDTLGISVYTVYRNLRHTSPGKRTIHTFPNLDTSLDQLNTAEHNRQVWYNRTKQNTTEIPFHDPSKEDS